MLRNYLIIALRHVARERGYSIINIAGLAIGMTCCLLIVLFVREELSFDRFHAKGDRVVRLIRETSALSAAPMGPALASDLPEVVRYLRVLDADDGIVEREDGEVFSEALLAVDSTFFEVFSFELIRGETDILLRRPDEIVLSESAARKYFGSANPVGRELAIDVGSALTMVVTGVVSDPPANSHLQFDLLASFTAVEAQSDRMQNWSTNWLYTYLLLDESADPDAVEAKLPAFFQRHVDSQWDHFRIQPLEDVRLYSTDIGHDIALKGDIRQVLLFSIIAALILLIACVNFVNLSTARAMRRAGEVGVRKVMGAHRRQLIGQFMGESIVTTVTALALAGVLVWLMLPPFRAFVGSGLTLEISDAGFVAAAALALVAIVGVIAGSYPALYLSSFRPVKALRGSDASGPSGALRKVLVVFQFAVSIFLIVGTAAIYRQLDYVRNARLGFEPDQTLVIPLPGELEDRSNLVKERVSGLPGIRQVSAAGTIPGKPVSDYLYRPEGWSEEDLRAWDTFFVDEDYVDVLDMTIVLGRNFDAERASDSSAFLLNEAAWKEFRAAAGESWDEPIGKTLDFYLPGSEGWVVRKSGRVIGVVKDFNYLSLHTSIDPLILHMVPYANDVLLAKAGTENMGATLVALQEEWKELAGSTPLKHFFLDESFDQQYRAEEQMGDLAGIFAALAVFIAAMGLFGLATFMTERRTKEIGVRKVLGASVASIVSMLSTEFVKLVLLAFVVAAPVAYWAVNSWLDNFAYRIQPSLLLFTLAGAAAVCIALLSVGYQALRAATRNPVSSLRCE